MQNLISGIEAVRCANAAAAGTTDINGTAIDMTGYRGVVFIALLGALTATQVTKLIAEQSDASDGTGDAYNTIASTSNAADGDGNKLLILDVCEPNKRYVRPTLDRGTANAVLDGIIALKYRPGQKPVIQGSTVSFASVSGSPNEV